jgi:hypothetical protein
VARALNVVRRSPAALRLVKRVVPERTRERIRSANLQRETVAPATRRELAMSLAGDLRLLEQVTGRTFPCWPTAAEVGP